VKNKETKKEGTMPPSSSSVLGRFTAEADHPKRFSTKGVPILQTITVSSLKSHTKKMLMPK
jgi:hypothetical protein